MPSVRLTSPFLLTDFVYLITARVVLFSTAVNASQQTVNSTIEQQEAVLLAYLVLFKRVDLAWFRVAFDTILRIYACSAPQVTL